jgi:hypothetical protein
LVTRVNANAPVCEDLLRERPTNYTISDLRTPMRKDAWLPVVRNGHPEHEVTPSPFPQKIEPEFAELGRTFRELTFPL